MCTEFPAMGAMLNDMACCEPCDMNREFCEHGLVERHRNGTAIARELLISPMGMAHFPGCPIRATIRTTAAGPSLTRHALGSAWNGEQLQAAGGACPAWWQGPDARTARTTAHGSSPLLTPSAAPSAVEGTT